MASSVAGNSRNRCRTASNCIEYGATGEPVSGPLDRDFIMTHVEGRTTHGQRRHVTDTAQAAQQIVHLTAQICASFCRRRSSENRLSPSRQFVQPLDGCRRVLEIREACAQPALVHIGACCQARPPFGRHAPTAWCPRQYLAPSEATPDEAEAVRYRGWSSARLMMGICFVVCENERSHLGFQKRV